MICAGIHLKSSISHGRERCSSEGVFFFDPVQVKEFNLAFLSFLLVNPLQDLNGE